MMLDNELVTAASMKAGTKPKNPVGPVWEAVRLTVCGENVYHMKVCATPARMKRLIPLPMPQPFWISSSSSRTMMLAPTSWKNITMVWVPGVTLGSAPPSR